MYREKFYRVVLINRQHTLLEISMKSLSYSVGKVRKLPVSGDRLQVTGNSSRCAGIVPAGKNLLFVPCSVFRVPGFGLH